MTTYYIDWPAQLARAGMTATSRFMRVVEELSAYPKIADPTYELDGGRVAFRFAVDGFDSPAVVRDWAERALRLSLYHARVGAPDLPEDVAAEVGLHLDEHPTVRPMTGAPRTRQTADGVQRR